jgi:hypothetical protein
MRSKLILAAALAVASAPVAAAGLRIESLSTAADFVSGGDALIRIDLPPGVPASDLIISLDGRDISGSFRPEEGRASVSGLVSGLRIGENLLTASLRARPAARVKLKLVNHPLSGPIVSGPQLQPFICQTQDFKLPDGTNLGPSLDSVCTAATRINYVYMPKTGDVFRALPAGTRPPDDVKVTTTLTGRTVPFIVRVETATINRGVHQSAVLFDPYSDPPPTPATPPAGWNRRLIAVHGVGCPGGWYVQGAKQGENIMDAERLGEGYAIFTNTLRHPSNSCNPFLAGETTMMDKEHMIETLGVPTMTVSKGSSGGAYTSLQVADAFPGLFDGVLVGSTFPDALSIALAGLDAHLLMHYFAVSPGGLTEQQRVAVSGFKNLGALKDMANQAQRTDPIAGRKDMEGYGGAIWSASVPPAMRYDPATNPRGARPTVFDVARNVYGVDPATGFARRPFDNVGVQYGLKALNAGTITLAQFLDLNERIGGYDQDANFIGSRSVGDLGAIRRAQEFGVALGGSGGLASIPVMNAAAGGFLYDEDHLYHYQWFHFAVRERMKQANGNAANHVMWRGGISIAQHIQTPTPQGAIVIETVGRESWRAFIDWVAATKADRSNASDRAKTIRNKPASLVDGCWTKEGTPTFIAEPQSWSSAANSRCNSLYPSYSFTREIAGGPLAANIYKCALRRPRRRDYRVAFSTGEWKRLNGIFGGGICDFSKPGIGHAAVQTRSVKVGH